LPGTSTIADAIADPGTLDGDTLCLAPGLYSPAARIDVTKQLHILGPKANVEPRPSYGSTRNEDDLAAEAILDGGGTLPIIMRFLASGIELNGVVVRNGTGDLIDALNTAPVKTDLLVRACIIHHSSGDEGVQLRNCDNSHIEYNYVHDTRGDAINFAFSNDCFIEHNECYNIASDDAAIYVYNDGQRGRINCTIRCNLIHTVTYNDGIKLGAKSTGADAGLAGGTVECNVIRTTSQDGISIYSGEVVVRNNEITGSTSENGALYVSFNVNGTQISDNHIHDNGSTGDTRTTYGIRIGKVTTPVNTMLSNNRLMNNEAQTWDQGTGSSWNANCYSDWTVNPYAIGGPGGYVDNNGSLGNCSVIPCQCPPMPYPPYNCSAPPCLPVQDLVIMSPDSLNPDVCLAWTCPQWGEYIVYSTTVENNDGNPPGPGWTEEARAMGNLGNILTCCPPSGITDPYRNYVVKCDCNLLR
jgi:hypothetical protein